MLNVHLRLALLSIIQAPNVGTIEPTEKALASDHFLPAPPQKKVRVLNENSNIGQQKNYYESKKKEKRTYACK